jgi:hypothetical protein
MVWLPDEVDAGMASLTAHALPCPSAVTLARGLEPVLSR